MIAYSGAKFKYQYMVFNRCVTLDPTSQREMFFSVITQLLVVATFLTSLLLLLSVVAVQVQLFAVENTEFVTCA